MFKNILESKSFLRVTLGLTASALLCSSCADTPNILGTSTNRSQVNSNGNDDPNNPGGSGDIPTPTPVIPVQVTDTFNIAAVKKADLLFIVDNSGSMSGEQATLQNSFAGFISSFITKSIDANIGVISTDLASTGKLLSKYSEKYLNTISDSASLDTKFRNNVNLGTNGDGDERALDSLQLSLGASMIGAGGYNEGFVRDDSLFVAIIVGDEDNALDVAFTDAAASTLISNTRNRVDAVKPNVKGGSRFEFVINKTVSKPNPFPVNAYSHAICGNSCPELRYPEIFRKFAAGLGIPEEGLIDITQNFSDPLAALGDSIANQAQKQVKLSKMPVVASIQVFIDGAVVAKDDVDGWKYVSSTNSIELNGIAYQDSIGHQLKIEYMGS